LICLKRPRPPLPRLPPRPASRNKTPGTLYKGGIKLHRFALPSRSKYLLNPVGLACEQRVFR
jgi:hypothetical protein